MIVCKVWDSEYPWDVRAEKVCQALTDAGHGVHLVANNRRDQPLSERLPEATVHRLPRWRWLPAAADGWSMFPAFFNPRWLSRIWSTARDADADVILCRDLPLAPTAIAVGGMLRRPVVLDMAENYAAMIRAIWDSGRQRRTDWLVRNPALVTAVERWVLRWIDHTLVVVNESRDRITALGVPASRVTVVSNTPPLSRLSHANGAQRPAGGPLRLVYLGLLEIPRGIGTLLNGVARCRAAGLPVRASIVGGGRDAAVLQAQAAALGLTPDAVTFHGVLPHADALALVADADVGVVPHHADESWNTTIPNKLFDYMAAGLAVLSSDARPCARVVRETGCGEVFRDQDPEDFERAVRRLLDAGRRAACVEAARRAIAREYHWELDAGRLVESLERVVREWAP